mmetsp:Transcript_3156/g.5981  ORF Transcript_3156/g.5981 Transcript_3156/m.5981 type:complete len:257 (-) Transcript_3156:410-1180(-)
MPSTQPRVTFCSRAERRSSFLVVRLLSSVFVWTSHWELSEFPFACPRNAISFSLFPWSAISFGLLPWSFLSVYIICSVLFLFFSLSFPTISANSDPIDCLVIEIKRVVIGFFRTYAPGSFVSRTDLVVCQVLAPIRECAHVHLGFDLVLAGGPCRDRMWSDSHGQRLGHGSARDHGSDCGYVRWQGPGFDPALVHRRALVRVGGPEGEDACCHLPVPEHDHDRPVVSVVRRFHSQGFRFVARLLRSLLSFSPPRPH